MTTPEHPETPHQPPPEPPAGDGTTKVLRRSKSDRVIAGVAGGLAHYFGIDPVLLRIAFVILALAGGSGFLLYLIGWIAIPEERPGDHVGAVGEGDTSKAMMVLGTIFIVAGALWLLVRAVPVVGRYIWPIVVILLGVAIVMGGRK